MKCLLLLLFPVFAFAQPKKATIFSKQSGQSINDSVVVWKEEAVVAATLFIGAKTITIGKEQYSIDSVRINTDKGRPFFMYAISLRGKTAQCYVYPAGNDKEWGLLLDQQAGMTLYKLRE